MFIHTWNKYLPVIKILLKRSLKEEQKLDMNKSDFERAAGGKKMKLTFSVEVVKGRIRGPESPSLLAKDLVEALAQDETTNSFIRQSELGFTMNSSFQLVIRNNTPPPEPVEQTEETTAQGGEEKDGSSDVG
ncbi:MAG: hypothetical protein E6H06_14425 [Bacteroidetes bacterium]|nr:MAG: hypothetical protein E6H06_14425 [Bacteroidota bacterium]